MNWLDIAFLKISMEHLSEVEAEIMKVSLQIKPDFGGRDAKVLVTKESPTYVWG